MNKKNIVCKIVLFFLLVGNIIPLKAQTADTCHIISDSIPQTVNRESVFKGKELWGIVIPAAMITYGVISIESDWLKKLDYSTRNELLEDKSLWYDNWDNYVQFSPAVAAFGMKLYGMESKHKLSDMLILYTLSNALEGGIIFTTKNITGRKRPDGSDYHSFPSGHTATAFVAAEFLHQEYGDKSVWISVGGYGMASLIGISRVYRNKHWVSDVVAGAGIGILSTKFIYGAYPHLQKTFGKKDKKLQTFVFPAYENGNLSLNLSYRF